MDAVNAGNPRPDSPTSVAATEPKIPDMSRAKERTSGYPSINIDKTPHPHLSSPAESTDSSSANSFSTPEIAAAVSELRMASTPLGLECALGRIEQQKEYLKSFAVSSTDKRALNDRIALLDQKIVKARSQDSFTAAHLNYTEADDILTDIRKNFPDTAAGLDEVLRRNPFSLLTRAQPNFAFFSKSPKAPRSTASTATSSSSIETSALRSPHGLDNPGQNCFINGSLQLVKTLARDLGITQVAGMPVFSQFIQNQNLSEHDVKALHLEIKPLLDANEDLRDALDNTGTAMRQEDARPLLLALLERCNIPSFAVRETRTVAGKRTILAHEDARTGAATPLHEHYFDLMPPPLQSIPATMQEIVSRSLMDHPITDYGATGEEIIASTKTTSLTSKEEAPQVLTMSIGRFSKEQMPKLDGSVEFHGTKNSNPVSGLLDNVNIPAADGSSVTYEPTSILCHKGKQLSPGHYITYRKEDDVWMKYNDSYVSVATEAELQEMKSEAYFVSYKKK